MPTYWNPRLVLDVDPFVRDFSCTGTTQKGSRCRQSFIDRKAESSGILDSLSRKDVVTHGMNERMKVQLRTLAENTLCPRWHRYGTRSQIEEVYSKWSRIISNFIIEERTRVHEQSQRSIPQLREALAAPVVNEGHIRRSTENHREQQESTRVEALADIQRLLDSLHRQIDAAEAARAALSRVIAPLPARQERVVHPPSVRDNAVVTNNNRPPQIGAARIEAVGDRATDADAPEVSQLPTPPQSPVHRHTHRRHGRADVERKPLAAECYICYEPFEDPDDAVWCRRRCGQNVHKECFDEWSRGKERHEVSCGYCRANWLWE